LRQPTENVWTSGIVNVPLNDINSRYTFFELDTKDREKLRKVISVYDYYGLACYIHSTINGYHFYNLSPVPKMFYWKIIREIKHLNPECPLITLRIIPNKWKDEKRYWNYSAVTRGMGEVELERFREWICKQRLPLIESNYKVVKYPFERCPLCDKESNAKYVIFENEKFKCQLHNIQTIGRLKK
jgi:hypothetical protein